MASETYASNHSSEEDDELPALHTDANLPNPDIMIWASGDEDGSAQIRTPPPHIAQRFYRSNRNRKRSSATSSRRNSMTSTHSHHSNRSFRSTLHRSTIAQHLRRASILEDRKARLQDRNAHAEQVRLRAALAKSPKSITNFEERALAAQQAREKHLAKVAATCAEEVNRSKRIAEENKERKAAEERRYKQEVEEKHAEAERRREEYKKNGRKVRTISQVNADHIVPIELKKPAPDTAEACLKIQRTWRTSRRRKCAIDFQSLQMTIDKIGELHFDEATQRLADRTVISRTGSFLRIAGLDVGTTEDATPVRTFLSVFMMLGHPHTIFSKNGEQEQDLISKARDLLIGFEAVLSDFASNNKATASETHLEDLKQSHATYVTAFAAYKARDASILIDTMVEQFVSLDAIWQTVKDDTRGEAASDYRTGIRNQQVMLYSKIKKLAGPARTDSIIKRAINQSRRQNSRRRPTGDVRPRQMVSTSDESGSGEANSQSTESIIQEHNSASQEDSSPDHFSRAFSVIPSNRVVIHELLIEPGFRIESSPESDLKSILNREMCDSMRRGIADGSGETWTVSMAENIRSRLLNLLKAGNSLHKQVSEALDPAHIQTQCRHRQFSYDKFFAFMAGLLPRLCAPVRDSEVKALRETLRRPTENTDAMIEKLFGLLHMIDSLSLDHANFLISQQAPLLIREGIAYEQRAFHNALENGQISLTCTTRWWRNALLNIVTESRIHDTQPTQQRPPFTNIYARGLVDLSMGIGPLTEVDIPETLAFDAARLSRIRSDLLRFVTVGGVLLTAKNLLKRDVRSQWKPEAKRAFDALQHGYVNGNGDLPNRILAIVESGHGMPTSSKEILANKITAFLSEASKGQLRDPILKLLLQRLRGHLFNRLAAQSSLERVRVASTTSEGLATIGLGEFIGQIGACADELVKIMQVDVQSHGIWHRRIAEEADGLGTRETPAVS